MRRIRPRARASAVKRKDGELACLDDTAVRSARPIILAAVLLSACASDVPPRHIADELARAQGVPPAVERVRGVIRVTLPGLYSATLLPPTPKVLALDPSVAQHQLKTPGVRTDIVLPATSQLAFAERAPGTDVSFVCPPRLTDRTAVLTANLPRLAVPFRCPAAKEIAVHLHTVEVPAETAVSVRGLETDRVEAGPYRLPANGRLRVALGLVPAFPDGQPEAGTFRITATDGSARTMSLLDRRLDPAARAEDGAWVPVDLDLEPVRRALGGEVRLVFEVKAEGRLPTFPVWGDPTIVQMHTDVPPRRNVVLISIDTLRADQVGFHGGPRATTPTLDVLAARSTVFDEVIAPAPWTLPSHTSMMTGLHSCVHGMTGTVGLSFPPRVVPLAERLRDAGYATAATTEDGFIDSAAFLRGFGYYWEAPEDEDRVRTTVGQAETWLRTEATEPFFLFVHTYQVHFPYFAPRGYPEVVGTRGAAAPNAIEMYAYDAAIRYTDASLAPLLAAIEASPRGDRTLLVVTSDHGEAFGEHGYTGHGRTLHEELLRVPLLVWSPGLVATGRRVPGLAGVIDVAPTILDLVGLEPLRDVTGISLAPQLRADGAPPPLPARTLYSENTLQSMYRLAARAADWKATWEGQDLTIVDLRKDPGEREPAATAEREAAAADARRRFEAECERQRAARELGEGAQPAPPGLLLDPERDRRLRALGYT